MNQDRKPKSNNCNKVTIVDLFDKPEHIPTVARWIYDEFWLNKPGYSPELFENLLSEAINPSQIPLSLLAIVNNAPAGTVNLIENDDETRTHLKPWLAALYVCPEFRSMGIGTKLVSFIVERAIALNYLDVYLGTDNPGFYQRLGADFYEQARPDLSILRFHESKKIMVIDENPSHTKPHH